MNCSTSSCHVSTMIPIVVRWPPVPFWFLHYYYRRRLLLGSWLLSTVLVLRTCCIAYENGLWEWRPQLRKAWLSTEAIIGCHRNKRFLVLLLPVFNPKIELEYFGLDYNDEGFESFHFGFTRDLTSNKYVDKCAAKILANGDFGFDYFDCDVCQICENGLVFKYDCSNVQVNGVNGTMAGPKSDTCIPVASVIASF